MPISNPFPPFGFGNGDGGGGGSGLTMAQVRTGLGLNSLTDRSVLMIQAGDLVESGIVLDAEDRVVVPESLMTAPSSIYLGAELKLSNAALGLGVELPTGSKATVPLNVYNDQGTTTPTSVVVIDAQVEAPIITGDNETCPLVFGYPHVVSGDFIMAGFLIKPLSAGELRYEVFLGTSNTDPKIVDVSFDIAGSDVGTIMRVEEQIADMIAFEGMQVYSQWSSTTVQLQGTTDATAGSPSLGMQRPWTTAIVQAYKVYPIATEELVRPAVSYVTGKPVDLVGQPKWDDTLGIDLLITPDANGEYAVPDADKAQVNGGNNIGFDFLKENLGLADGVYVIDFTLEGGGFPDPQAPHTAMCISPTAGSTYNPTSHVGYSGVGLGHYRYILRVTNGVRLRTLIPRGYSLGANLIASGQGINQVGAEIDIEVWIKLQAGAWGASEAANAAIPMVISDLRLYKEEL